MQSTQYEDDLVIKSIEKKIIEFGSDYPDRFGGRYEGGIHIQQSPFEMSRLIHYLKGKVGNKLNYLEIGCAAGGFTFIINHYFDIKNNILIDDNKHHKWEKLEEVLANIEYTKWVGDSQSKQARDFVLNLGLEFDIILIDADHSYNGVKKDTETYVKFLKKKGFMIFHDITIKTNGVKSWTFDIRRDNLFGFKNVANFIESEGALGIGVYRR